MNLNLCAITPMYTLGGMLWTWPCSLLVSCLLVSLLCMCLMYTSYVHLTYNKANIITSLFFKWKAPRLSTVCHLRVFKYHTYVCLNNISILHGILITLTMALHMNNDHIRYYHMDATHSVGLALSYFSHPYYLVIKFWVCTTVLFPDSITQTGPHVHYFVKFFPVGGWHA